MPRGEIPQAYAFLSEIHTRVSMVDYGTRVAIENTETRLHYRPGGGTSVEYDAGSATIHLDVRYVEDVCDLVSCLFLPDMESAEARAYLLTHRMALDAALVRGGEKLVVGLLLDYVVSKATADILLPDVSNGAHDLEENKGKLVAEVAAVFAATHEVTHWKLAHDPEYRKTAIARAKEVFSILNRHSEAVSEETRGVAIGVHIALEQLDDAQGGDLPEELEEIICDIASATAISRASAQSANRDEIEAVVWSASVVLWARTRLKKMLLTEEFSEEMRDVDRRLALQRGLAVMFCLAATRWQEHLDVHEEFPPTPLLDALEQIVERAVAAFFDGKAIQRFVLIGAAATHFEIDRLEDARTQIERISGWV